MKGLDQHIQKQWDQHTDAIERAEAETEEIQAMIKEDPRGCMEKAGMSEEAFDLVYTTMDIGYSREDFEQFEEELIEKLRETLT